MSMVQTNITERRFGGMARLYGVEGAAKVAQAHVMVVGIGGVGSWVAESLARSGVGELTLVDLDHIAESNINRQIHALESSVGQAKVMAMKDRIAQINPECRVHVVDDFVTPENWLEIWRQVQSDA
ncbi:MAG: ThiF family adenylyltransferase, partial [Limnohabitans sp.]